METYWTRNREAVVVDDIERLIMSKKFDFDTAVHCMFKLQHFLERIQFAIHVEDTQGMWSE